MRRIHAPIFYSIRGWMQREDPNGSWSDCEDCKYMYETILEWVEDGLNIPQKRIDKSLEYLSRFI